MCQSFSCIITREGKVTWEFGTDSHSDLVEKAGLSDLTADKAKLAFARVEITPKNKDYRKPDEWVLRIDEQAQPTWWCPTHEAKCRREHTKWLEKLYSVLDTKKEAVHPFEDIKPPEHITKKHKQLLKQWIQVVDSVVNSVWHSVWHSVGNSVWNSAEDSVVNSVWHSVWNSVWHSVEDSVGYSGWHSVRNSVRNSVRDSVRDSVWDSVRDSVWAQVGSLFKLSRDAWKYTDNLPDTPEYPFSAAVDLWNMGLVPSFDGSTWRLHGGSKGEALFEATAEDLTSEGCPCCNQKEE